MAKKMTEKQKATQFKKGKSGNPKGRPKKALCIPDILKAIGKEPGTVDGKHTKLDIVLRKVFEFALDGQAWAIHFIADRTEGRAIQKVEQSITGKMGISEAIVAMHTDTEAAELQPEGEEE
jgi:hypothetical protein